MEFSFSLVLVYFSCCSSEGYSPASNSGGWVRALVGPCKICGEQRGIVAGFLRVLLFPLPIIPLYATHSSSSITIRSWCNRPVVDSVPPYPKNKKIHIYLFIYTERGDNLVDSINLISSLMRPSCCRLNSPCSLLYTDSKR
jgi:hypothetical protein